ncbi:Rrf2 family transcriptional regulator [Bradyrhizobium sp. LHD-71]|uniref:RrF2 family transcriptional regulator n=1 Tax=Bradyrhizobium sp. LHD-71 TaxID=3072141 RepID=UPI00280FBA09|nr:Rrf2 family transcriptional regulator [Bradyrhizobium sp. LHD-71]MDQ8731924.1 Rrf2 family transcriptional regulator [Bradyrhizobium sp. LHD-71]
MSFVPQRGVLAVLAVVDVALNASNRPLSAKSLAARYNLAPRYLEPMLQMLVQVGILKGIRGPRGGYRLARPASELTVDDIFRAALDGAADAHPFLTQNPIVAKVIIPSLEEAERALAGALSSVTVETLAARATAIGVLHA